VPYNAQSKAPVLTRKVDTEPPAKAFEGVRQYSLRVVVPGTIRLGLDKRARNTLYARRGRYLYYIGKGSHKLGILE
jgi:hypothetical protein